ncbi:NYN domain-containing protein [Massilia sp. CFBP9012]|uniref:NYN domain-containing protein n=1 Tax=Massilia sp. CFBP9012 TaxID=3096531 RepID=UPI002A69F553|nr:NYN domain-containing protein [Massilia sp. CFBP9012]MDY0977421.1 NYN domain-containing protein [Massilia sp. CFBP9012]
MASSSDNISMAVFCDFENVALGVRDANYEKFDIRPVLERLLLKGSIVVKKSYCDWDRYKAFKAPMHEANFELIEIPHVRQSGKNSADIRLVVDALDLCYTKSHVNTFVIISGDSDFSPLVSKLRENNKQVIGVGVKQSTSDLLVANCDEFIFYDDLVREQRRTAAKRDERKAQPQSRRSNANAGDDKRKEELEARKLQALDMVVETFDALVSERGDTGKIWASLLKDTLKRRRPDFSETYYGFRTFGNLLEEAQTRGLFEFGRDEKSGTFVYRSANAPATLAGVESVSQDGTQASEAVVQDMLDAAAPVEGAPDEQAKPDTRRGRGRGGRKGGARGETAQIPALLEPVVTDTESQVDEVVEQQVEQQVEQRAELEAIEQPASQPTLFAVEADATQVEAQAETPAPKERRRAPRKPSAKKLAEQAALEAAAAAEQAAAPAVVETPDEPQLHDDEESDEAIDAAAAAKLARYNPARPAAKAPARKAAPRSRRPAKPKAGSEKG